jgi:hypothetical protein
MSLACMSLARKNQTLLNMSRVGGDAYVRYPQKRAARHCVNFQAIAFLQSHVCDEALQCRMDRLLPIEAESNCPDPPVKFVRIETALDRHPGTRMRLVFEPQGLREKGVLFDQNGSGSDQLYSLSTCWGLGSSQLIGVPGRKFGLFIDRALSRRRRLSSSVFFAFDFFLRSLLCVQPECLDDCRLC